MPKGEWLRNGTFWNYYVNNVMVAYTFENSDGTAAIEWYGPKGWFIIIGFSSLEEAKRVVEENA